MSGSSPAAAALRFALSGCGRAGGTLGFALARRGGRLEAVAASSPARTAEALAFLDTGRAATSLTEAARAAPLVFLAVPDRMLEPVARELARAERFPDTLFLHRAGALTAEALAPLRAAGAGVGSCHPLLSLNRRQRDPRVFEGASFAVDGDPEARRVASRVALLLGGRPFDALPEGRVLYHAGGALAANALVTLLDQAAQLLQGVGLERGRAVEALLPLVRSTLGHLERDGAEAALTGPIRRGDAATVRRHLEALPRGPLREAYVALARLTLELARRAGLEDPQAAAIETLLAEAS